MQALVFQYLEKMVVLDSKCRGQSSAWTEPRNHGTESSVWLSVAILNGNKVKKKKITWLNQVVFITV